MSCNGNIFLSYCIFGQAILVAQCALYLNSKSGNTNTFKLSKVIYPPMKKGNWTDFGITFFPAPYLENNPFHPNNVLSNLNSMLSIGNTKYIYKLLDVFSLYENAKLCNKIIKIITDKYLPICHTQPKLIN